MIELLDTSMSKMDLWTRCDRRYFYRYVRGLVPVGVNTNLQWGTLFHYAAQVYYRTLKAGARGSCDLALKAIEETTVVPNAQHGDTEITLDVDQRTQLADTFRFYYDNLAIRDAWDEIVAVEEPIYLLLTYRGEPVIRIRSTIDLLARKNGQLCVVDHKTTGDVEQNLLFLGLDMQAKVYPLTVKRVYGEDVLFCYNMIAREVPPGYGHRSVLTDTGKKRAPDTLEKMQRPERYLRREWLTYTNEQYDEMERTLVQNALIIRHEKQTGIWPRRVVKMGGMQCSSCDYFAICTAELAGREMHDDSPLIAMAYTRDPLIFPNTPTLEDPFV